MADQTQLGKKAEAKVKEWLNKPEEGFCFDRIPDQLTGFFGSSNICDFVLYRYPHLYYIESKATFEDRFDFSMFTSTQHDEMIKKAHIEGVISYAVVLFASYKRAFLINMLDIESLEKQKIKSLNIKKIAKWKIPYIEIQTIPSRKELLDYDFEQAKQIFA